MRKALTIAVALAALIALSMAGLASAGGGPVKTVVGNLELSANGGFSPTVLPKKTAAPIALTASGTVKTTDGSHPPALKEVIVETDKDGYIDVTGYPTCSASKLQSQDTKHAEAACKSAIIGKGTTTAGVKFPEQSEVKVNSKLLVVNGGVKGGVTTLYIHAYFTAPIPGAIVTTLKISKVHNGPFGTKTVASIPKIAGGNGSVLSFSLTINKKFTYKGKKRSILYLSCPDGKVPVHVTGVFDDGTKASVEFIRPCTGRG